MAVDPDFAKPIRDRYAARIMAFLKKVQAAARTAGYVFPRGPYEASDDQYRWELAGRVPNSGPKDLDALVGFSFSIYEAPAFGNDPLDGINFSFDIVSYGGRMIGNITPYNYTSQVWVSAGDERAVEARFRLIEDSDLSSLAEIL